MTKLPDKGDEAEDQRGNSSKDMSPSGSDGPNRTAIAAESRELIEEIAEWDAEKYPLAKHAQRILENLEE